MAELHEALKLLGHTDWDDIPQTDLSSYLNKHFEAGELLCNSIPLPPNGSAPEAEKPHFQTPNAAKSANDVYTSPVRPKAPLNHHETLQKNWGKPMKFSQKENPLHVALYKMAGHDRHGAWFARHSILEGISFSKFKKAMMREFPETLLTQGVAGAGAIRGLSAERRVERIDADGGGRAEVYQLSAQMPSPVSPRDFLTLFLTTDQGLTEKSPTATQDGTGYIPRHFMVVSKALDHPKAPQRSEFVRGSYESVELMREIPVHTIYNTDPELNPLEWIMVTRSDPAGGLPRFLIERGTPGAMLTDVTKFLNWACGQDEITDPDEDVGRQQQISEQFQGEATHTDGVQPDGATDKATMTNAAPLDAVAQEVATNSNPAQHDVSDKAATTETATGSAPRDLSESSGPAQGQSDGGGVISSLTSSVQAGITAYAPVQVSGFVSRQLGTDIGAGEEEDSLSESSSDESFLSANELERLSTAPEHSQQNNIEGMSVRSGASSAMSTPVDKKNMNRHDKEVLKIMQQREKLDDKVAKKRETEEAKLQASQEKDQTDQEKARERMEKELKKTQDRHQREVEKLEAKRERSLRKAEEKRRKKDEQNKLSLVARERDDLRSQAGLLRKENALLADQVETLQRENTALASLVGRLGGPDALKNVQDEIKKTGSIKSDGSRASLASTGSGEKRDSKEVS